MRPRLKVEIKKFSKRGNSLDLWHFGFSDSAVFSDYLASADLFKLKK